MTKDQESGGAPLEQLPDEALCRLIREQDRPAEEVLAARYHRVVPAPGPIFWRAETART